MPDAHGPFIVIKTSNPPKSFRVHKQVLRECPHFRELLASKPHSLVIHEPNISTDVVDIVVDFLYTDHVNWQKVQHGSNKTWRLATLCVAAKKLQLKKMYPEVASALMERATKTDVASFLKAVEHVHSKGATTSEFRATFIAKAATLLAPSLRESPTVVKELLKKGGSLAQDMYHARGQGARQEAQSLRMRIAQLEAQREPYQRCHLPGHGGHRDRPRAARPQRPDAGSPGPIWDV